MQMLTALAAHHPSAAFGAPTEDLIDLCGRPAVMLPSCRYCNSTHWRDSPGCNDDSAVMSTGGAGRCRNARPGPEPRGGGADCPAAGVLQLNNPDSVHVC